MSFIDPKKSHWAKIQTPKNPLDPLVSKILSAGPQGDQGHYLDHWSNIAVLTNNIVFHFNWYKLAQLRVDLLTFEERGGGNTCSTQREGIKTMLDKLYHALIFD